MRHPFLPTVNINNRIVRDYINKHRAGHWTENPLYSYDEDQNLEGVKYMLKVGIPINSVEKGSTILLDCCENQAGGKAIKFLLENGADPNFKSPRGWTPLSAACEFHGIDVIEQFIKYGADLNLKGNRDFTALHMACIYPMPERIKYLIEQGADPNIQNDVGCTPFHYCFSTLDDKDIKWLLEHGADPDIKDENGDTPDTY